jgi:hypothetical protein
VTYDSWKLDNAEDEADRKARAWGEPRLKCAHCDVLNGPRDGECRNCGEPLDPNDDAWEPDPDDARDAMMDRMLDQRWDSD